MKKCYKYNMNNVGAGLVPAQLQRNTQKGITLVALVITIIVLLILVVVSINLLINNGIIGKAKGATFKSEIKAYEEELKLSIVNDQIDKLGQRTEKFNVRRKNYNDSQSFTQAMREKIPSFKEKYAEKLEIQEDELVYIGMDEEERNWFKEVKMNVAKLLEIKYVDEEGNQIAETYKKIIEDETYSVIPPEVEGYLPDTFLVEGKLTKDTIITVTYYRESRDLAFEGLDASENVTEVEADIVSYQVAGIGNFTGTNLVVPEKYNGKEVTKIKDNAFKSNSTIKNMIISKNINAIGQYVCGGCSKLTSVIIDAEQIGQQAFKGCTNLQKVQIGSNVSEMGVNIFYNCKNLSDFTICTEQTLTSSERIFYGCTALKEFKVNKENKTYKVINGVVYTVDGSKIVFYPTGKEGETYIIPEHVTTIGAGAFQSNTYLTNITIPENVEKVEDRAFQQCTSLTDVYINATRLDNLVFYGSKNLTNVQIGKELLNFNGYAIFNGCKTIENFSYLGTMAEWNQIKKVSNWQQKSNITSIICTDGTIEL